VGREIFWGPGERARVCGQSGGRGVGELQFKFTFMTDRTGGRRPPRRGGGGWEVGLGKCVETGVLLCEVEWLVVGWEIFFLEWGRCTQRGWCGQRGGRSAERSGVEEGTGEGNGGRRTEGECGESAGGVGKRQGTGEIFYVD